MKRLMLPCLLLLLLSCYRFVGDYPTVSPNNRFGFLLIKNLVQTEILENPEKNIFISPISAAMALQMLLNGAGQRSSTYEEIKSCLQLNHLDLEEINASNAALLKTLSASSVTDSGALPLQIIIANSLWKNDQSLYEFNPFFIEDLENDYDAEIDSCNFNSPIGAFFINDWASSKTHGKIPQVVTPDSIRDMAMLLMNATYFKANWDDPFDPYYTVDGDHFTQSDGTVLSVSMMNKRLKGYTETALGQVMELPYVGGNASMYVFLPHEGTSLASVLLDSNGPLTGEFWNMIQHSRQGGANFFMPKFRFDDEIVLNDVLKSMGMRTAFEDSADFSQMGRPSSKIDFVKQNTFINVDEEGTEAAAVTTIGVVTTSLPTLVPVMKVDRPFLFLIVEKRTKSVLFVGIVQKPLLL